MSKKLIVNGAFVDKSNNISPENSVMVNFPGDGESASATTLSAGNVEFKLNNKVSVGSESKPIYIKDGMAYEATVGVGDKNVQADWSTTDSKSDSYIKNKPTIPTAESLEEDLKNVLNGDYLPLSGGTIRYSSSTDPKTGFTLKPKNTWSSFVTGPKSDFVTLGNNIACGAVVVLDKNDIAFDETDNLYKYTSSNRDTIALHATGSNRFGLYGSDANSKGGWVLKVASTSDLNSPLTTDHKAFDYGSDFTISGESSLSICAGSQTGFNFNLDGTREESVHPVRRLEVSTGGTKVYGSLVFDSNIPHPNLGSAKGFGMTAGSGGLKLVQHIMDHNALTVSGTVEATSIYESSDIELKENIGLVSSIDTEKVKGIEFKEYNFKDDSKHTKKYGVIAQEVEEAGLENLVKVNNDGLRSVDYISLLCLKMEAMQKEMEALKAELKELKEGK